MTPEHAEELGTRRTRIEPEAMRRSAVRPGLKASARAVLGRGLRRAGYTIVRTKSEPKPPPDLENRFLQIYDLCSEYTMTPIERMYALYQATRYVVEAKVPGDVVECGVWRGGSAMLSAMTLEDLDEPDRMVYLYDTFEGMSEPTEKDIDVHGAPARDHWDEIETGGSADWCYAPLEDVQANMRATGFPSERLVFVRGKVEETIPGTMPERISLLRLDTDWYESTYHELSHLLPRLSPQGVIIIDDYGYWAGAREATDRYLNEAGVSLLWNRIDHSARMAVKA